MQKEITVKFTEQEFILLIEGLGYYLEEAEISDKKTIEDCLELNNRLITLHRAMLNV